MADEDRREIRSWRAPAAPISAQDGNGSQRRYDRARDLPRLLPVWPHEIDDHSPTGTARLIRVLQRALRRERQRGLDGHWSYDLARHRALLAAYNAEQSNLSGGVRSSTQFSPVPARFGPRANQNRRPIQISLAESGARPTEPNDLRK